MIPRSSRDWPSRILSLVKSRTIAALVTLVALYAPATALAQSIVVSAPGGLVCSPVGDACDPTVTPSECGTDAPVCEPFNGSIAFCVPPDALWCSTGGFGCPDGVGRMLTLSAMNVCVPDAACVMPSVMACFTRPAGSREPVVPVSWNAGDCDSDGLSNGRDPEPCTRAPAIGLARPDGTCTAAVLCAADTDCEATERCETLVDANPHRYCRPDGPLYGCCGGEATACANGASCAPVASESLCENPGYCPSLPFAEQVACLRFGGRFVSPPQGDCDGDTIPNEAEVASGLDPCVFDDVDAGMPIDAGGSGIDASVPPPGDEPSFRGGGGCGCRAAPPRRGSPLAWLLALGLLLARRRSARSSRTRDLHAS